MPKTIRAFLLGYLIFALSLHPVLPALAQEASLLPNAVQQFFDNNGNPLSSGKVYFYEVGTTTFKDTYTSSAASTTNPNPITLNAGGKAPTGGIYGIGTYQQVVRDRNNNLIWSAVTAPGGGGSTPSDVGDGNLVGTVLPWSGLVAPNQYVFAYGQEIARATYPEFYTAVTQQLNVICSAASNTLTGLSDTTQIRVGSPVELSLCVAAGTTVVTKTASTITLSNPSSVSINATATFFPWGNGNGTTTFNVPDYRGVVLAGRTNMGGSASSNLTVAGCPSISPDSLGASCGNQTLTLDQANLPAFKPPITITDPGHNHNFTAAVGGTTLQGGASALIAVSGTSTTTTSTTGITAALTNNLGSGTAFSLVQPSKTINYVVKITPDTSSSIATGVYSIGGMTGVISCGSGLLCTGNIISTTGITAGGPDTAVQFSNAGVLAGVPGFTYISPDNLVLGTAGITGKFDLAGSISGKVRQVAAAVAGTPTVTWGNSSGTPAVAATSPISLNTTTGNVSCPTCLTSASGGAITASSPLFIASNNITISPDGMTRVNDTNVTLTFGGSPTTATISPVSLTMGWTGQLGLTRGGTGASLTASNGGIVYSNASTLAILSGTATANLPLLSGSSTTPSWAPISYPTSANSGGIPYFSSSTAMASSSALTANQIMIGGGAGAAPSTFACATTTTVVHGGTPPTCSQIVNADITANTISNDRLATVAARTVKGNPTGSTAAPTDVAAAVARSSSLLNIDQATATGDADYTILSTDRLVYHTSLSTSRTDTLPAANSVNAGQVLYIADFGGQIISPITLTIQRAGADTVNGSTSAQITAQYGAGIFWSDGTSRWTYYPASAAGGGSGTVTSIAAGAGLSGGTITSSGTIASLFDPTSITNCTIVPSVSGNALTVALKTQAGSDPSASSPCVISFRNSTITNGDYTAVQVTAATSFSTGTSGSTFGSTNGAPFRLWVVAMNNAGTVVLGVSNRSVATQAYPIVEGNVASSTACSACTNATSANVYYTTAAQTNVAVRAIGFLDWEAGLATAGTYASAPTRVVLKTISVPGPGQFVGNALQTSTTTSSSQTSSTYGTTNLSTAFTLTSAINLVEYEVTATGSTAGTATQLQARVHRGTSAACTTGVGGEAGLTSFTNGAATPFALSGMDAPKTASTTAYFYTLCIRSSDNATSVTMISSSLNAILKIREIMG